MELKDFVSETLKQIIDGVTAAQEYAQGMGARVAPSMDRIGPSSKHTVEHGSGAAIQDVDFDVVVTTSEAGGKEGSLGIFVGPVGLGAKGKSESASSAESRIKFSIPLMLRVQHRTK